MVNAPRFAGDAQIELESRAEQQLARAERGEITPQELMGTISDWTLEIGPHRVALVPPTGEWLYYDAIHGTWEPTGYKAGEVRFGIRDGELGVRPAR